MRFRGTAVSRGTGVGRALILDGGQPDARDVDRIEASDVEREVARFAGGIERATGELTDLAAKDGTGIFGVHLLILEDAFANSIERAIRTSLVSAESAVRTISAQLADRQRSVRDDHIREKYLDIYDVAERLIRAMNEGADLSSPNAGSVYIVSELTPSLLIELARHFPRAIISEQGGWTSHTSILAREYRIPAITGVHGLRESVSTGDVMVVDGFSGEVILHPAKATLTSLAAGRSLAPHVIRHDSDDQTETADGTDILVRVNANLPDVYDRARREGACGIGLYRSEILFDRANRFPEEGEQYDAYREIATLAGSAGVRIRTFDVGVDRLRGDSRRNERNPSLGLRAVRLSLTDEEYFRTQVRAILRASHGMNVGLVLPMISGLGELIRLRTLIEEERASLESSGTKIGHPPIGAMIETPSAVITARQIATSSDFLCLGTNDLVQYLLAVDRDNPLVADWYQTLHPAVLKAIKDVIDTGVESKIPVAVCGEMAGSTYYIPLLIGMGTRELSMNVNAIAQVRSVIGEIDVPRCTALAEEALLATTTADVESCLRAFYKEHWPGILTLS
jgi:phosphotransferase system enzyme I (PtsI)